jgi:hypothetical protein
MNYFKKINYVLSLPNLTYSEESIKHIKLAFHCIGKIKYNEVPLPVGPLLVIMVLLHKLERRPKISCSPSYADYRPKTNAMILLDTGHICIGEIGKGKET